MTWSEIGQNHLAAAKLLQKDYPRSSASRAYYAAHVVLAEALMQRGWTDASGRQTPPHQLQSLLIGKFFAAEGKKFVRDLRSYIRRLYDRRLDADYKRTVTLGRPSVLDSIRESSAVFVMLKVK